MAQMHVMRVFAGEDGSYGNLLGVFLDGRAIPPAERQAVAADIGFSETVFVDDPGTGRLQVFTPAVEMGFAGHPLVGAAWLLATRGPAPNRLLVPDGEAPARVEGEIAYVAGRPEWGPPHRWTELRSPEEVEALAGPPGGLDMIGAYAWLGEDAVRARVFLRRIGIEEDEATGSAAIHLGALLGRPVTVRQGRGSVIHVRPLGGGVVEIGGRVVLDEVRDYPGSPPGATNRPKSSS